jgi:5-oxoprolinase (ATP-hydrolysing)
VGGNVLTSQRVVDVILRAFGAAAASQGCMNNFTFGDKSFGYYETIAGGAGAGPSWDGRSGVQVHMTNTRTTDVEVIERRYPVLVRHFGLRKGSGGRGLHPGGDGVVREFEFLRPVTVSVLSERRALAPFGLAGGGDALRGLNLLLRRDSPLIVNLGGKNSVDCRAGDRVRVLTPGGGGYGASPEPEDRHDSQIND